MIFDPLLPYWKTILVVVIFIGCSPLLIPWTKEMRCAYVVVLMALFWMFEVVPLPVTALFPVIFFPLLGVLNTKAVCINYLKESNMMFMAGLMCALAVERVNLHTRITLWVILKVGTSVRRLMVGMMMTAMFLSMWISNTATTAMMLPIVESALDELTKIEIGRVSSSHSDVMAQGNEKILRVQIKEETKEDSKTDGTELEEKQNLDEENEDLHAGDEDKDDHEGEYIEDEREDERKFRAAKSSTGSYSMKRMIKTEKKLRRMRTGFLLALAYSCNIGGLGTLTGTSPNFVLKGMWQTEFPDNDTLTFFSWMVFACPIMLIAIILAFCLLQFLFFRHFVGRTKDVETAVRSVISKRYKALGRIQFQEYAVIFLFTLLVILWIFRKPIFVPGWGELFKEEEVEDATAGMFIVLMLFITPKRISRAEPILRRRASLGSPEPVQSILTWNVIQERLPWGIVILLGGGYAMADATKKSGLNTWISKKMVALENVPTALLVVLVSASTAGITEIMSNSATSQIMLPVLANLSRAIRIHPVLLMFSATVSCSFAFMLPVATPPNAIVFLAGNMRIKDMVKAGVALNFACVGVCVIVVNTWGYFLFNLGEFPDWAKASTK